MHAPALGSAAATLAVSLIYLVSAPSPDAQVPAARVSDVTHGIPVPTLLRRAPIADRLGHEQDCSARCEVPQERASVHWMEYLEYRRVTAPASPTGRSSQKPG
jgi:hypothetical protein